MELRRIEKLIEKYLEAETTTAEERELKQYFAQADVAPQLQHYTAMFAYFKQEATGSFTKQMPLKRKINYTRWVPAAASVVLVAGMFAWYTANQPSDDLGTYDTPEEAFAETQKALNMLSKNVNVGVNSINYIGEYEETRKTIFKE
ncbi:hypothetical protein ACLI09_06005 [Flavobacterium sp. RHBU_24]|uniref:hypothetical protein n=1 Tax=Flavobacterium sp. RHBU_24 TaxID=3391185 RepID=UPI0039855706